MAPPKERETPELRLRVPSLQPTVRPTNVFTPVASLGISRDTEELLKGLRGLKGELDTAFTPLLKEDREENLRRGIAAQAENQLKLSEAVAKGIIPETANPWFIKGYYQGDGRVLAIKYDVQNKTAWSTSDVKNSDSAEGLMKWLGQRRKDFMAANPELSSNPDVIAGFTPSAELAEAALVRQHVANRQEEISARVRENTGTEVSAILTKYNGDAERAAAEINILGEKMKMDGLSPTDFRKIVADQAISTARLTSNPAHLRVLDLVKLDNGQPLSTDAAVKRARAETDYFLTQRSRSNTEWAWRLEDRKDRLEDRQRRKEVYARQDEEWARTKDRWNREDLIRQTQSTALAALFANPEDARNATAKYIEELGKHDIAAARSVADFVETYTTRRRSINVDDRDEFSRLRWEMISAAGDPQRQTALMKEAIELNRTGKLNDASVASLNDDAQRWRTAPVDRVLQSDQVRMVFDTVDRIATKDRINGLTGKSAANALMGRKVLRDAAMEFLTAHPDASPDALAAHMQERLKAITPMLNPDAGPDPTTDIGSQARAALGRPDPTIDALAARMSTAPATKALLDAVAAAQSDAEITQILVQFDERSKTPGLARRIIELEARKASQKPKPKR